jgi:hypothetical protein
MTFSSISQMGRRFKLTALVLVTGVTPLFLPVSAYTIEGKIEHQEALPSVDDSLRRGARFNASLSDGDAQNNWVKVPDWLAGTWSVNEETATLRQNFKTGEIDRKRQNFSARQEFTYGSQKDRQEGIWHYIGVPYRSKTRLDSYQEFHDVKEKQFLVANQQMVQFRTLMTVVRVSNSNGRITDTFQQESITSYRPLEDGVMQLTASNKTFDAGGRALYQQDNEARIKRFRHFSPVNRKDGKDLKALFIDYLAANGMSNLIP